jgi:Ca2+-binding EF-hand superfamily protein
LDGYELLSALAHEVSYEEAIKNIDDVFAVDDLDGDGLISYEEFVRAQRK